MARITKTTKNTPALTDAIAKKAESYKKEIKGFLKELIAVDTTNPLGKNYGKITKLIEKKCKSIGLKTRVYVLPDSYLKKCNIDTRYKRYLLIAEQKNNAKKTIHFNAHYDVVPASEKWKPFTPREKGNRLYGRGSVDMKASIAAYIYTIKILNDLKIRPKYNIQLSFVPDEETGGYGFSYGVEKGIIKGNYFFGEGAEKNKIWAGNKGVLWANLTAKGKSAHGAYPYKGINAFENAVIAANELLKIKNLLSKKKSRYNFADARLNTTTMTLGGFVDGKKKVNTIPSEVSFSIDIRMIPEHDKDNIKKKIISALNAIKKKNKGFFYSIRFFQENNAFASDTESCFAKHFKETVGLFYKNPEFMLSAGATDLRFLASSKHFKRKKIVALGYNPSGNNFHADNEYVDISSLIKTTKIYSVFLSTVK